MRRLGQIGCLLVAFSVTDLHWFVLQSITWAEMIASASSRPEMSLSEAVVRTLSGESPCSRCEAIQEERDSDREQILELISKTLILAPISNGPLRAPSRTGGGVLCPADGTIYAFLLSSELDPPPRA